MRRRWPVSKRRRLGSEPIVRLERASVYLDEKRVLENLSFEVRPGDCWVIHGHNGSGKTTLLRTLYGDHGVASGGRIQRAGIVPGVPLQEFKEKVGIVAPHLQADHPQDLTVAEVVQSGRHASIGLNDAPSTADRAAAKRSLAFFGLSELAGRTLKEISYGQLRRVLFARAWVCRPSLLLLDEPFLRPGQSYPIEFNGPCGGHGGIRYGGRHDDALPGGVAFVRDARAGVVGWARDLLRSGTIVRRSSKRKQIWRRLK